MTMKALLIAAVVLIAGGTLWLVTRSAPERVDIGRAVEQLPDDTTPATTAGLDGAWAVDASIGEFSVEQPTGSFAGFRVDEQLVDIGARTAVGRTPGVTGSVELDATTLTAASIEADLTQIVSDESRRDRAIQRALETQTHPTATFELTAPVALGTLPADGAPVEVTAAGDLTIHGVTRRVEVPLQVALTDGVGVVTTAFDVSFADYQVQAPTAPVVLSVADQGVVELQLFLRRTT